MPKLNWMRHLFSLAFLCSCLQYQALDENKTTPLSKMMTQTAYNCSCYDGKGRIYNLAPLQRKDRPRFTVSNAGYKYSYNPCRSFSLGGDCSGGDVAVCLWVKHGSRTKIGSQSFFSCGSDTGHDKPQLIYSISKNQPDWKVRINLKCNQSLRGDDDGKFHFISSYGSYEFRLTHNCACPDGCPQPTPTTPTTSAAESPIEWKEIVIAASGGIFLIICLCLAWLKLKRQNNEENERQRLIDDQRNLDHINNFNDLDDGRRTENLSQPMSVSSCSRSDNMESAKMKNKDMFNVGSVPV